MVSSKIKSALATITDNNLYRQRLVCQSPQTTQIKIAKQDILNFSSNDYLGLANHAKVVEAMQIGSKKYGVGSGASHLISGHSEVHEQLEYMLADFLQVEQALLFCSGFMANIGVLDALLSRGDLLIQDKLNHASLIDGGRLARAKMLRFMHGDFIQLAQLLAVNHKPCLVASDAVFSMDGDVADINKLVNLCHNTADLYIDEAHSFGVLGENGRGVCAEISNNKPIIMATCGKALGTVGAVVAGSKDLIQYLIHKAHSYIYTTAMPASIAYASIAALKLLKTGNHRRENLLNLVTYLRGELLNLGFDMLLSHTPIQVLIVKDAKLAMDMSKYLFKLGILVPAIRPPTVPKNTARLRITLSADHTKSDIDKLLLALKNYG